MVVPTYVVRDKYFVSCPELTQSLPRPSLVLARASGGSTDEIEALAAKGVELSAPSGSAGLSALHRATLYGSVDALRTVSVPKAPR